MDSFNWAVGGKNASDLGLNALMLLLLQLKPLPGLNQLLRLNLGFFCQSRSKLLGDLELLGDIFQHAIRLVDHVNNLLDFIRAEILAVPLLEFPALGLLPASDLPELSLRQAFRVVGPLGRLHTPFGTTHGLNDVFFLIHNGILLAALLNVSSELDAPFCPCQHILSRQLEGIDLQRAMAFVEICGLE